MDRPSRDIDKQLIRDLAALLTETGPDRDRDRAGRAAGARRARPAAPSHCSWPHTVRRPRRHAVPPPQPLPMPRHAASGGRVTSPMVGTAYRAPEPGAQPSSRSAPRSSEGQTLLIIEAMKTMNQIPAPRSGTVTHILVEDGQPVEYGEPLLVIE